MGLEDRHAVLHQRNWVTTGIGDAAGEHRHDGPRTGGKDLRNLLDLRHGHERGDIEAHALTGQLFDERSRTLCTRIRDRDLDHSAGTPSGDPPGLSTHLLELIREHFERYGTVGDVIEYLAGKSLVVSDTGFPHQCGIGGESLDPFVSAEPEYGVNVSAVSEQLDSEGGVECLRHHPSPSLWRQAHGSQLGPHGSS